MKTQIILAVLAITLTACAPATVPIPTPTRTYVPTLTSTTSPPTVTPTMEVMPATLTPSPTLPPMIFSATSVTQQGGMPEMAQHTPIEFGTLQSGQTATKSIPLGGGPTLFALHWQNGTLAFTLIDPNNQTIDPTFAVANPSVVTYSGDANAAVYYFPNAIAGTWQTVFKATSVQTGGLTYSTFAAFDSDVTLTASADKNWYTPGANAIITATLTGPLSSATITASIGRADGITDKLTLSSIGNGQYQASYTVPNAPGNTEVRLVASGTTASNLPFERGAASLIFQISPNTFALNNTYTDTPALYPGSSLYQFLNVTVGINATVGGKVGLSADLVDWNNNFVAHALVIQDVAAGPTILTLQFDGTDILASKHNGPYTLTNVLLTDESGTVLVTQQAQAVYTTAPYLYTNFTNSLGAIVPLNVVSIAHTRPTSPMWVSQSRYPNL